MTYFVSQVSRDQEDSPCSQMVHGYEPTFWPGYSRSKLWTMRAIIWEEQLVATESTSRVQDILGLDFDAALWASTDENYRSIGWLADFSRLSNSDGAITWSVAAFAHPVWSREPPLRKIYPIAYSLLPLLASEVLMHGLWSGRCLSNWFWGWRLTSEGIRGTV